MKSTGIIRCIDALGRFVIPAELRNHLDIKNDDPLEVFVEEDRIILRKYAPACLFCGGSQGQIDFEGKKICRACLNRLKRM